MEQQLVVTHYLVLISTSKPILDLWSAGTVMAEIYLKSPIFLADNAIDQIVQIIKVFSSIALILL